jgi:hypothetical protein
MPRYVIEIALHFILDIRQYSVRTDTQTCLAERAFLTRSNAERAPRPVSYFTPVEILARRPFLRVVRDSLFNCVHSVLIWFRECFNSGEGFMMPG